MDRISWNHSFEVGHSEIDEQHRRLLENINWFEEEIIAGEEHLNLINIAKDLYFCFKAHFKNEESLMKIERYLAHQERTLYHKKFLAGLGAHIEAMKLDHSMESCYECYDYLYGWFFTHLLEDDPKLYHQLAALDKRAA